MKRKVGHMARRKQLKRIRSRFLNCLIKLTGAAIVSSKLILFEDHLIIDILYIGQIEVRFRNEKR